MATICQASNEQLQTTCLTSMRDVHRRHSKVPPGPKSSKVRKSISVFGTHPNVMTAILWGMPGWSSLKMAVALGCGGTPLSWRQQRPPSTGRPDNARDVTTARRPPTRRHVPTNRLLNFKQDTIGRGLSKAHALIRRILCIAAGHTEC